ncbi:APC family permease [Sphingomonas sp. ID1715]|uniref:APC family permease n=1 Tax=Sphingomonas sp. ID1715 TaxID=1656898 RepID=UPI001488F2F0|nr:APC family permease [Sphingomonas sp. ID1715]NNM75314.1 APC family permease [Sphingomonas sp. ID1715]
MSFQRSLGTVGVLLLTLSATTPASSVFVIVPEMLQVAGSGALIAMLLAAVVCVATAFVYAELSSAFPVAGGEYVMVGRTLGPLAGFVMLAINLVNNLLFPAVIGLGLSDVLSGVLPGLPVIPTAITMVALSTLAGILHIRLNAWLTGLFLLAELAALAAIILLGFAEPMRGVFDAPVMGADLMPATPTSIGLATTAAIFALNGYGLAVYFGEEMHEAADRIARVVLLAAGLTIALELAPLAAAIAGAPDLPTLFTHADPFGWFARARGGDLVADLLAIAIALAILNAAIAGILAYARFFYSTGRDAIWGKLLDPWVTRIHPRLGSPWIATVAVGAVSCAACFLPLRFLLVLSGAGIAVTYLGIALAAIVGRRTGSTSHAAYRMPWFPIAPLVTVIALVGVFLASWLDTETGRPGLIATLIQMLAAALYYALVLRRRGGWTVYVGDQPPAAAA